MTWPASRHAALARLRHRLERTSWPRLQMSLIVAVTGLAGWLLSAGLWRLAGVDAMALRYPLAVAGAWLVFLALLWAWLRLDVWDAVDLFVQGPGSTGRSGAACSPGGGGDFGGGGASASFAPPDAGLVDELPGAVGRAASASLEAEEGAVPLLALLLVAAMALGLFVIAVYLVQLAPTLLAELLLDGGLSVALYRRLDRRIDPRLDRLPAPGDAPHWLTGAVRRTALPFALTAVLMAVTGAALAWLAPGAHSLGEVIARWRA